MRVLNMDQETLRNAWLPAPDGRLCAWEIAKALAMREASKHIHDGKTNLPWIAERANKVGGGNPKASSLHELFAKIDADPEWFPGKHSGLKRGRKPVFTKSKRLCVARSAMAKKATHNETPSVEAAIARCPAATFNPLTGQPFCEKTIRSVFTEECYDFDPEHPWRFQIPLQKVFLPPDLKEHRLLMSRHMLRCGPSPSWWAQHVVWFDPCCSIIPGSQRHYDQMRQALKGAKQYISNNAKLYSTLQT